MENGQIIFFSSSFTGNTTISLGIGQKTVRDSCQVSDNGLVMATLSRNGFRALIPLEGRVDVNHFHTMLKQLFLAEGGV